MKKKLEPKTIIRFIAMLGVCLTGSFIFVNLVAMIPLVLFLAGSMIYFHNGSSGILQSLPFFIKVWYGVIITFLISLIISLITKMKFKRKNG